MSNNAKNITLTITEITLNSLELPMNVEMCLVRGNDLHNYIRYYK